MIAENAAWPQNLNDKAAKDVQALKEFKEDLMNKTVSFWDDKKDLNSKVILSLSQSINLVNRPGWVRASDSDGVPILSEVARLSQENNVLRKQVESLKETEQERATNEISSVKKKMFNSKTTLSIKYADGTDWEDSPEETYYLLYIYIASHLQVECEIGELGRTMAFMARNVDRALAKTEWPMPLNTIKDLMTDFMSLGLVQPSTIKHSVNDNNEYWSLTKFGVDVWMQIRRSRTFDSK